MAVNKNMLVVLGMHKAGLFTSEWAAQPLLQCPEYWDYAAANRPLMRLINRISILHVSNCRLRVIPLLMSLMEPIWRKLGTNHQEQQLNST